MSANPMPHLARPPILLWAAACVLALLAAYGAFKFMRVAELRLDGEVQGVGKATAQMLDTWLADRQMVLEVAGTLAAGGSRSGADSPVAEALGAGADGIRVPEFSAVTLLDQDSGGAERVFFPIGRENAADPWRVRVLVPLQQSTGRSAIQGDLDLTPIQEVVERLRFKQLGHAFLIDEQSTIIAHPIKSLVGQPLAAEFQGLVAMDETPQPVTSSIGKRLLAFFPLDSRHSPRWTLVADINRKEAHDLVTWFLLTALALPLALVLAGIAWIRRQPQLRKPS